jgi:hypothetical protein
MCGSFFVMGEILLAAAHFPFCGKIFFLAILFYHFRTIVLTINSLTPKAKCRTSQKLPTCFPLASHLLLTFFSLTSQKLRTCFPFTSHLPTGRQACFPVEKQNKIAIQAKCSIFFNFYSSYNRA